MNTAASRDRGILGSIIGVGIGVCCCAPATLWGHRPSFTESGLSEYLMHGQMEAEAVWVMKGDRACGDTQEAGGPQVGAIPSTFRNPVLQGSFPDPSICRVGSRYYLVNGSQAWFPGLPVHCSSDLVHWDLIGYVLNRPERTPWARAGGPEAGIWSPTIRYGNGLFVVMATARGVGSFCATAVDPKGPWSDPAWLACPPDAVPSLFLDDDGAAWAIATQQVRSGGDDGHLAVSAQKVDLLAGILAGPAIPLIDLDGRIGSAAVSRLYKIEGAYCLRVSGWDDRTRLERVFYSDAVGGPYRPDSSYEGVSAEGQPAGTSWSGPSDWVQVPEKDWWAVQAGVRSDPGRCVAGPEIFLASVTQRAGRPVLGGPSAGKDLDSRRPDLTWAPLPADPPRDDFSANGLALCWNTCYPPVDHRWWSLSDRPGYLRLRPLPGVPTQAGPLALWARRVRHFGFRAVTRVEFDPSSADEIAGLILMRDHAHQYRLEVGLSDRRPCVSLYKVSGQESWIVARRPMQDRAFCLGVRARGLELEFLAGASEEDMTAIGEAQDGSILCARAGGAFVGVYASNQGGGRENAADFDWFEYDSR
jgi:xylan 1,4-beta-xylosidase